MANVTVKLTWNGELRFTAQNGKGFETALDGNTQVAPSPMELLIEALGGCTAIDVVLILQKMREPLTRLEVKLEGDRNASEPRFYTKVRACFDVWGDGLKSDKVARAVNLSFAKYCSVYHSLRKDIQLSPEFRLHQTGAVAAGDYQRVVIEAETSAG